MNKPRNIAGDMIEQGNKLLSEGSFESAESCFSACLVISPMDGQALKGRAAAWFHLKNWTASRKDYARASELDPDDVESRLGLDMCLAMENRILEPLHVNGQETSSVSLLRKIVLGIKKIIAKNSGRSDESFI